ncbi:hypothetical protein [Sicyoidochytrium minutum DNA virus]|nr:hypothetical protein [Sicyoidochytrium minutum DNA virus]BDC16874.1 hypothetical protein [Sicyoidochytrium minutum DNA virus]
MGRGHYFLRILFELCVYN